MKTSFNDILTDLRNNNGFAMDAHNKQPIKIEAIALLGDRGDVVAMPADVSHYSINGMYVSASDGRAWVSTYSFGTMFPEMMGENAEEAAAEWNKPEWHTPGLEYRRMTNVTYIEEKNMNTQTTSLINSTTNSSKIVLADLLTRLDMSYVANNPLPNTADVANSLFGRRDNKLFGSVTKILDATSRAAVASVTSVYRKAMDILSEAGLYEFKHSPENNLPEFAGKSWVTELMAAFPDAYDVSFSALKAPFEGVTGDALCVSFVTKELDFVAFTEMAVDGEVDQQKANDLLSGALLKQKLFEKLSDGTISDDVMNKLAALNNL